MELFNHLALGFSVALTPINMMYALIGTLLGTLIGMFDTWAAERLWEGDWMRFAMWFLAGLGFIQAGGSLVEVMSTVAAGLLAAVLVNKYVIPLLHRGEEHRGYPLSAPVPAQGPNQSP